MLKCGSGLYYTSSSKVHLQVVPHFKTMVFIVYVRDVERQQIDLDALARLDGEREGARSRPNSPGRAGRAEETRPAIHHRFSATAASSCTAGGRAAGVGPDHVVANSVSLSLHSPESPAYVEHREDNPKSAAEVIPRGNIKRGRKATDNLYRQPVKRPVFI